jgi:hypothetical protein
VTNFSQGGEVKSNFVSNYKAAKAAGFGRIDAYLFPCTGTQPNGVACKSPSTQLSEFLAAVDNNGMSISHYWFDIEPTSTANGAACNAWNLGASANEALAKQWVSLLQNSGRTWGIYANGFVFVSHGSWKLADNEIQESMDFDVRIEIDGCWLFVAALGSAR